ncbi:MAG: hypothetical protein HZY76_09625 [Anaerolineae bacterium]|nr:MAG: hypothetical protein HZY76_09625 [Anaerolineae bacterium]
MQHSGADEPGQEQGPRAASSVSTTGWGGGGQHFGRQVCELGWRDLFAHTGQILLVCYLGLQRRLHDAVQGEDDDGDEQRDQEEPGPPGVHPFERTPRTQIQTMRESIPACAAPRPGSYRPLDRKKMT